MTDALVQYVNSAIQVGTAEESAADVETVTELLQWAHKRERQRKDLAALQAGRTNENEMSWFSGGRARACRLLNSPY